MLDAVNHASHRRIGFWHVGPETSAKVLGLEVARIRENELVALVLDCAKSGNGFVATYATAHTLVLARKSGARSLFANVDVCYPDGFGVSVASCLLGTGAVPKTTANRYFSMLCARAIEQGLSIALLGGKPGVAQRVARTIAPECNNAKIWARDGFALNPVAEELMAFAPNILFIAMGQPKQECVALELRAALPNTVIICVGGLFDVVAGVLPTCPECLRSLGLEWSFRLLTRPTQVWRRYVLGLPMLAGMVAAERAKKLFQLR